ncbi:hypothetical protein [Streptomyces sp. NPDC002545]
MNDRGGLWDGGAQQPGRVSSERADAHDSVQSAAVCGLATGRLVGGTAALVALTGVAIGGLALARSRRTAT